MSKGEKLCSLKLTMHYRQLEKQLGRAANILQHCLAVQAGDEPLRDAWRYATAPEVRVLRKKCMFCAHRAAWREQMGL